jgi:hypothetical protein
LRLRRAQATAGKRQVSKNADFHCVLRFERDATSPKRDGEPPPRDLDVINDDGSTAEAIQAVRNETIGWVWSKQSLVVAVPHSLF